MRANIERRRGEGNGGVIVVVLIIGAILLFAFSKTPERKQVFKQAGAAVQPPVQVKQAILRVLQADEKLSKKLDAVPRSDGKKELAKWQDKAEVAEHQIAKLQRELEKSQAKARAAEDELAALKNKPERRAVVAVNILNAREGLAGTAELYLKIQSTLQPNDVGVLIPLNVGKYSGNKSILFGTPFGLHYGEKETLRFELLDEDHLSDEDEKKILDCVSAGTSLLWIGTALFKTQPGNPLLLGKGKALTESLATDVGQLVLNSLKRQAFDSFGSRDYHVADTPPADYRSANAITICDGTCARADIRVFYPPAKDQAVGYVDQTKK